MMKFTFAWLKEHLDTDRPLGEIADKLTMIGLEVERIEDKAKQFAPFVIARVTEAKQHPNADRLRVCMVDTGDGKPIQVVCGAPNARAGMKGVFAPVGAFIPGKNITLGVGKIRDVESRGMLVSEFELQISADHEGIIDLPDDAPVGQPYAKFAGLDDPVLEINLTPNRGDATGVHGIARDLAAADMGKFKDAAIKPVKSEFPCPVQVTLDFGATPSLCPAFGLRLVRGVNNGPSPDWLQKRLTAIGLRPINALVDITNFITYDRGRPLHVFDAAKVHGNLTVRRARKGETLLALDGKTYALDEAVCVIADEDGVESLSGIMGGEKTGCSETTTDVLDRIGVMGADQYRADRTQARHQFRRALPFRARRRSGLHAAGARTRHPHGDGSLRRRAVGSRCRRQRRAARAHRRFSAVRARTAGRHRRAAHRVAPRARTARLLRRRPGRAGENRGAVVAAGCGGQSRYRRGSGAHSWRRPRAADTVSIAARRSASRCSRRFRRGPAKPSARWPRATSSRR